MYDLIANDPHELQALEEAIVRTKDKGGSAASAVGTGPAPQDRREESHVPEGDVHDVQQQNDEREQEDPEGPPLGEEDMNLDEDPEDEVEDGDEEAGESSEDEGELVGQSQVRQREESDGSSQGSHKDPAAKRARSDDELLRSPMEVSKRAGIKDIIDELERAKSVKFGNHRQRRTLV